MGILIEFNLELQETISQSGKSQLELQLKITKERSDKTIEFIQKKTVELNALEEKERKANEENKWWGYAAGALGILVGALLTPFGGVGIALLTLSVGLFIADVVHTEVKGESLTGMIMAPIMEPLMKDVIMPVIQAVAGVYEKILGALGVPDNEARKVASQIMATVAVVATAIFLVALVRNVAALPAVQKLMGEIAGKIGVVAGRLSQGFGSLLQKLPAGAQNALATIASKLANAGSAVSQFFSMIDDANSAGFTCRK